MQSHFRFRLFFSMIVFAIIISFTIATQDHLTLRDHIIEHNQYKIEHIEEDIKESLSTLEKAYYFFDKESLGILQSSSYYLKNIYEKSPSIDEWDFVELSRFLGVDIYFINEINVITHSSFSPDVGLDFSECCRKLVPIFEERRRSGEFFSDGIESEQQTGRIKKYSYLATDDKKYLIQLSLFIEDGVIYETFNFKNKIDMVVQRFPFINEINVLNIGGLPFGEAVVEGNKLTEERRLAFEQTLANFETNELKSDWNNESALYRYVHHVSNNGTSQNRVIEIVYHDRELQLELSKLGKAFVIRLVLVLIITIVLSLIIARWIDRPMYLAFHDSLTGLKNRAAFEDILSSNLEKNKGTTGLLMIDLDNFKLVNDYQGHDRGDELLKAVAQCILANVGEGDSIFRLGGDEFMVVLANTSQREAEHTAVTIIETINEHADLNVDLKGEHITVSIGIALASGNDVNPVILRKQADIALYKSKEKGKNQYQLFK